MSEKINAITEQVQNYLIEKAATGEIPFSVEDLSLITIRGDYIDGELTYFIPEEIFGSLDEKIRAEIKSFWS